MSVPAPAKTRILLDHGFDVHGIVHVGMNDAEEFPDYLYMGMGPLLGFEPQPVPYHQALAQFGNRPDVRMFNLALGDQAGKATIRIPARHDDPANEYLKSASLLLVDEGAALYQQPVPWQDQYRFVREFEVPVHRFDELVRDGFIDSSLYNTAVIDVEGYEMHVLRGMGDYLEDFTCLSVECSLVPGFTGQAAAAEVSAFLAERGFEQLTEIEPHNDVFFGRRR